MIQYETQLATLTQIISKYVKNDGVTSTPISSLQFIRQSNTTKPIRGVYKTSLCFIIQGAKEVWLGDDHFTYSPTDYLVSSVALPVTAQVTKASLSLPYLAFTLEFTVQDILEVLNESEHDTGSKEIMNRGMYVSPVDSSLLDALIRLINLIDSPNDIPVLSSLYLKEVIYRVLQGPHGNLLKQIALDGSSMHRVRSVISHIINNFDHAFRVEELAELSNMSVASLYRYFKDVTAMSPLQFQKHFRLQEARRLLLSDVNDISEVAFKVGYESPSQFSREYARMFGLPPREDKKALKLLK